jgi:hypothetical protein
MNCRECEALLLEIARRPEVSGDRAASAETGAVSAQIDSALEHAAVCASCAERLAEERAVTAELRRLALAERASAPSVGCEATLMAAYRTERGREVHTRRWIFAVSGAMAASLVVLLGVALVLSSESSSLVRSMTSRIAPLAARNHGASAQQVSGSAGEVAEESAAGRQEEVTNFVPFYPGADVSGLDGGALVRVRVPSSALGAFGLPAGQGSEDQWVSADLLVGEDGSPQAIRFVRLAPQAARN